MKKTIFGLFFGITLLFGETFQDGMNSYMKKNYDAAFMIFRTDRLAD
jgi:hypothetical protein